MSGHLSLSLSTYAAQRRTAERESEREDPREEGISFLCNDATILFVIVALRYVCESVICTYGHSIRVLPADLLALGLPLLERMLLLVLELHDAAGLRVAWFTSFLLYCLLLILLVEEVFAYYALIRTMDERERK